MKMTPELTILIVLAVFAMFSLKCKEYVIIIIIIGMLMAFTFNSPSNDSFSAKVSAQVVSDTELKKTPNPRINTEKTEKDIDVNQRPPTSSMRSEDYTMKGMQRKLDERTYSKTINTYQTPASRAKLLNSMYSDMINESVKKDPYLRTKNSSGCEVLKGQKQETKLYDC